MPIITANLYEARSNDAVIVNHSTVAQWLDSSNDFGEGEDRCEMTHAPDAPPPLLTTKATTIKKVGSLRCNL